MSHHWQRLGTWPAYQCSWCGNTTIRSIFGWFWPDVLVRLAPWRFGCRPWETVR